MLVLIVILAVIVLLLLIFGGSYNGLVSRRNRVDNAWSQIDVQLKRRHDLIPNLVETVKGYASHERQLLENVTQARANAVNAQTPAQQAGAENALTQALRSVFAVAENYPQLKANENFLALQEELSSTESRIAYARQHYNDSAMAYNTATETFPRSIVAGMFGFRPREYFEAAPDERGNVDVHF